MNPLGILYIANFLLSFHLFLVVYYNSSFLTGLLNSVPIGGFLGSFTSEQLVGWIFTIGSALGIISLILISKALNNLGNYRLLISLTSLQLILFFSFSLLENPLLIILLFILYLFNYPLILYTLDVFLENYTKEVNTGSVRGTFLTTTNTALIVAPLIAGLILNNVGFGPLYFISALFLIPFLLIMRRFRGFKDPQYHKLQAFRTFRCILTNKNLYRIFMSHFLMRFFFSWMVIYMPIYLTSHIGFTWAEFGILTFIVLLPFAILELPAGKIADKLLGEKELLSLGFFIAGLFIMLVSFIEVQSFIFWAAVLFMTRVGMSLVEIMTESYFFKHVDGDDNNTISFFRITRPLAYITGPIIAFFALQFLDFQYIWVVLGLVTLYGLRYSLTIKDTR